ncbi:MAG: nucleotidyl transferase AbiEii/AbiGii toxin family protein [bacterium]|nr:nucleotidyl transferase AbiEii/AbiGii toxin family protein [bacterium]
MYPETLAPETQRVLEKISKRPFIQDFYLVGGTALALHFGHRESLDLDFFSAKNFPLEKLKKEISALGEYQLVNEEEGTLDGVLDGVKLTFIRYEYPLLFPLVDFDGVKLADERDIACMKIDAISSRGSKKDFVDLYFLLEKHPLSELLSFFEQKYSHIKYNKLHLLKSLAYFDDAEKDMPPKMIKEASWDAVKEKILKETKKLV